MFIRSTQMALCFTIAASTILNACATTPEPKIVTQTVSIPVAVACVDKSALPIEPAEITLAPDARIAADQAAGQALRYKAYARELYALIVPACVRG